MLTVTPTVTTTYFVTITDANGCEDIVDQEIIVHPLPTAVIDITETSGNADDDGDICLNDMITLTASGGTSYVWSSGEVTDVINPVLPVGTHTFTVTVTDVNGCSSTSDSICDLSVGIEEAAQIVSPFEFYLNGDQSLEVTIQHGTEGVLTISDLNGRTVYSEMVKEGNMVIPGQNFSKGIYFLTLTNSKNTYSKRIYLD